MFLGLLSPKVRRTTFGNFFKSFLLDANQKTGLGRRGSLSAVVAIFTMPYLAYIRNRNLAIPVIVPMLNDAASNERERARFK